MDRLPQHNPLLRWIAWGLPPFALPFLAAVYLRTHWNEIPPRFAIHWGFNGEPNGWASRTLGGVYGPLLFGAGVMLLVLLLGVAILYGSRRAPQQVFVMKILIASTYFIGLIFSAVGIMPLIPLSPAWFIVPIPLFVIAMIVYTARSVSACEGSEDPTPPNAWHWGVIYYNPGDPSVFVPKRFGFGYTFNFANRLPWWILGGFLFGLLGLIYFLVRSLR